jgi:outer membrane receptor for monomeric catechols
LPRLLLSIERNPSYEIQHECDFNCSAKAQTVNDVLCNVSGVSQNHDATSGNQPNFVLRGFPTAGGVLHDGYLRPGQNSFDRSSIQQSEVLKGPASVLYGQQPNTGGMINILSKKPLSTPLAEKVRLTNPPVLRIPTVIQKMRG